MEILKFGGPSLSVLPSGEIVVDTPTALIEANLFTRDVQDWHQAQLDAVLRMRDSAAAPGVSQAYGQLYFDAQYGVEDTAVQRLYDEFGLWPAELEQSTVPMQFVTRHFIKAWHEIKALVADKPTELRLSQAGLYRLPTNIGKLTSLTALYLFGNQLCSLPNEITHLTELKILQLGRNDFGQVPIQIYALKNLEMLTFAQDYALEIPCVMSGLTKLKMLFLVSIYPSERDEDAKAIQPTLPVDCQLYT